MSRLDGKRYNIITFGCQMNEHDSETMAGLLQESGCTPTEERQDADIVIINTCSVRENADKRFFGTLGQLKKQKVIMNLMLPSMYAQVRTMYQYE